MLHSLHTQNLHFSVSAKRARNSSNVILPWKWDSIKVLRNLLKSWFYHPRPCPASSSRRRTSSCSWLGSSCPARPWWWSRSCPCLSPALTDRSFIWEKPPHPPWMRGQLGRGAPSFSADQRAPSTPQIFNKTVSRGEQNRSKEFLPLCKVKEGVFLNESRFVSDSV